MNQKNNSKNILLVEDETIIAMAESRVLKDAGYTVVIASSGEKAIANINSGTPVDLILMDIDLGKGMDGVQAAEIILKKNDLPIVFLSSHSERAIVEKTERVTSYGYIFKYSGDTVLLTSIKMAFKLFNAHRALIEKEQSYQLLTERFERAIHIAKLGIWEYDIKKNKITWDDRMYELYGVEKSKFNGTFESWSELIDPDYIIMRDLAVEKILTEKQSYDIVFRIKTPDNSPKFIRSSGVLVRDSEGKPTGIIGVSFDYTDQKRYETSQQQREEELKEVQRVAQIGGWEWDINDDFVKWTDGMIYISGLKLETPFITFESLRSLYTPESWELLQKNIQHTLQTGEPFDVDLEFLRSDNSNRWVTVRGEPISNSEGKIVKLIGTVQDITERKRGEQNLINELKLNYKILETTLIGVLIFKKEGRCIYANKTASEFIGASVNQLLALNFHTLETWKKYGIYDAAMRSLNNDTEERIEAPVTTTFGKKLWLSLRCMSFYNNNEKHLLIFMSDIGKYKQAEETLKLNAQQMKSMLDLYRMIDASEQSIFNFTIRTSAKITQSPFSFIAILDKNEQFADVYGCIKGKKNKCKIEKKASHINISDCGIYAGSIHSRKAILDNNYQGSSRNLKKYPETCVEIHRYISVPVFESNRIVAFGVVANKEKYYSITELNVYSVFLKQAWEIIRRKRAEEELRNSESKFKNIFSQSPVGIEFYDAGGTLLNANQACLQIFGVQNINDVKGFKAFEDPNLSDEIKEAMRAGKDVNEVIEFSFDTVKENNLYPTLKSGSVHLKYFFTPLKKEEDHETIISGYLVHIIDISERIRSQELLMKSVIEKDILMRELQHRVKNNLNVIHSLLYLEMDQLQDERSRKVFLTAQSRIQTMVNLYEILIQSKEFDTIDLNTYLEELACSLMETYSLESQRINLITHMDEVKLDMKRAVPIGLIVNELITNALKYAFPDKSEGEIRIDLHQDNEQFTLCVSDNGIGFHTEGPSDKREQMGLKLVRMLSDQIEADFAITQQSGTSACITFKL